MEATINNQLNIPEVESNIYMLPSGVYRDRRKFALPISALFLAGEINSFSGKETSYGISECRRTYAKFCRDLGLSLSTVYRSLKKLTACNMVEKASQSGYIFKKQSSPSYLRIEATILKQEFDFEGIQRRLTPTEALVFAYFYTRCNNPNLSSNELERTTAEIAFELNISKKATQLALCSLRSAKFIYRKERGRNLHKKSVYGLHRAFKQRLKAYNRKQAKEAQKAKKAEAQTSELKERELWLNENRERAIARAERCERLMLQDYDFKQADGELRGMSFKIAQAELSNSSELKDLLHKQAKLQARKQTALYKHKLTELDLEPQFNCKACSDTGFKENGTHCDCFERWKQRDV